MIPLNEMLASFAHTARTITASVAGAYLLVWIVRYAIARYNAGRE